MNEKGITLVELTVVVSIIVILSVALGVSYVGWQGAYRAEKATKEIYSDLMDARGRAMARDRQYYADFNTDAPPAGQGSYTLIEDANENGVNDPDADLATFPKRVEYPITWSGVGAITFARRGTITPAGTIRVVVPAGVDPDYDCINVGQTRINLGQWDGGCVEK